jgi:hypothetical protein
MAFSLLKSKTGLAVTHRAVSAAVRGILRTTRLIVEGEEGMLAACGGAPPVYAFWHGKQMPLLAYEPKFTLGILVSHSPDGELLARILQDFGHRITRGSSTRGGAEGLSGLEQLYREGCAPAFAADGPRGPYHVLKPGAVRLAAELQRPLCPASAAASRCRRAGSWDRLEVVAPLATVAVVFGPPLRFVQGIEGEALKRAVEETGMAIDACTSRADELIRTR